MATINQRRGKLVIDFRYLGVRCREQTILDDTPGNRRQLKKLASQIDAEIMVSANKSAPLTRLG